MKQTNNQGRSTRKVVVLPAAGYHGSHIIGSGYTNGTARLEGNSYCKSSCYGRYSG